MKDIPDSAGYQYYPSKSAKGNPKFKPVTKSVKRNKNEQDILDRLYQRDSFDGTVRTKQGKIPQYPKLT